MKNLTKPLDIERLESKMLECEQIKIEPTHTFSDGMYARQIVIPKDTLLLGHEHKVPCLNILAKGKLLLKSQEKETIIEAPYTFHTKAGVRKIGYAIEECVFINVFKTDETCLKKLEGKLIVKSKEFLEGGKKCLG